jgi:hypothetical protein
MSDPIETLLNSPRTILAMKKIEISKDDLRYMSKDELKAKIGNMKITKGDLELKWNDYEKDRKDKIALTLDVSPL